MGKVPKDGVISGVPSGQAEAVDRRLDDLDFGGDGDDDLSASEAQQQVKYGQCGGHYWSGPQTCESGWRCEVRSELYSQCKPPPDDPSPLSIPDVDTGIPDLYVHVAVAEAFGGKGVSAADLCPTRTVNPTTTTVAPRSSVAEVVIPAEDEASEWAEATEYADQESDGTYEDQDPEEEKAVGDPLWFGCFRHPPGSSYIYSNEQAGFTSSLCIEGCKGFDFALLHNSGHCSCGSDDPRESHFEEVPATTCGSVCPGEESLTPSRYCGGFQTFAVYLNPT